jgi:hypothetical protein
MLAVKNRRSMTRQFEGYPLIDDIINGYRRFSAERLIATQLRERHEAPRPSLAPRRPEVPHTGLSIPALSPGERVVLRRLAPTMVADLDQAERLHSSPMRQTSQSIPAGTTAGKVDRLRRRAREVIGEHRAAL